LGYKIKLEAFEGPFDLLLHLIEKAEVDIYAIPIAQITEEYLDYLNQMKKLDLEVTSEFLVIAATLIKLKSVMLLPKSETVQGQNLEDDDEILKENLIARLVEYKYFKDVATLLKQKESSASLVYFRKQQETILKAPKLEPVLNNISLQQLCDIFMEIMDKINSHDQDTQIKLLKEEVRLEDKMVKIIKQLTLSKNRLGFTQLFNGYTTKIQIIVTFLAVLELIRQNKIDVFQANGFGEIYLFLKPSQEGGVD
jgi:segregation and condensation protein A